jgi:hypothetical protein
MTVSGIRYIEVGDNGEVTRHAIDAVGNNLTATLRWCSTHLEPVWVYGDGSYECPHAVTVGWSPHPHDIASAPWERLRTDRTDR